MPRRFQYLLSLTILTGSVSPSVAQHVAAGSDRMGGVAPPLADSAAAASVVTRFHEALAAGDSATALSLLSDDVVILETGGVETLADYRAHHLPADIAFARAVPSQRAAMTVHVVGDAAWSYGTSVTQGEYGGRQVNSSGAELVVLTRQGSTWKIRAIHWSSRARRPAGGS